jgi:hypothetical protein
VIDASPPAIRPAAHHGEPAQVFPANALAADGRPGLDGVICWSRIGAVRSKFTIRRFSIANRQAKDLVAEGAGCSTGDGAAATRARRRSKSAGNGCAPALT